MNLGFGELLLIFIVIILVFGSSKLPALGDALGRGIKNFKRTINEPEAPSAKADAPGLPAPGVKVQPPSSETVAKK